MLSLDLSFKADCVPRQVSLASECQSFLLLKCQSRGAGPKIGALNATFHCAFGWPPPRSGPQFLLLSVGRVEVGRF